MSTGCVGPRFTAKQGNENEKPCLKPSGLLPAGSWCFGELGVRSGQTLTAVARGINDKMGL